MEPGFKFKSDSKASHIFGNSVQLSRSSPSLSPSNLVTMVVGSGRES